jgi:hypothetical protein
MTPQEVAQRFRFGQGIETKLDEKAVPVAKLLTLENGVFTKGISIIKRNGYEDSGQAIDGSVSTVQDAIRMARRGDELLEFTASRCYSRQTGAAQWSDAGPVYSAVGSDRPLVTTGTDQTMPDHATLNGVTVAAWEDSAGGVWWTCVDATSGRVYRVPTQADANGISPRCVAVGQNLHVYYAIAAQGKIMVIVVSPLAPGNAVTPVQLLDSLSTTTSVYDACPTLRTGTPAAIAWATNTAGQIGVGYVDQSGVVGSPLIGHPSVLFAAVTLLAGSPIAVSHRYVDGGNGDRLAVSYVQTGAESVSKFFSGGAGAGSPIAAVGTATGAVTTSIIRNASEFVGATLWTAWEETDAEPSEHFVRAFSALEAGTIGSVSTLRSVALVSRAFAVGSDAFAVLAHDTTFFNTYVTFRISNDVVDEWVPAGRHLPASAAGAPTRQHVSSAHVSDSVVSIAVPARQRLVSENNDKFIETAIRRITMDFDSELSHQSAEYGRGVYLAGACPMHYDGRVWTELGFHVGPEVIATVTASGGSMTSSTTYGYRVWYEWTDAQGEIHRGPTSPGTLVTMGASDTQVTLTLPTLRLTRKSGVRIMVARSRAGSDGDASTMFRVTSLDTTTAGSANGYVANDTTVDTVTFLDQMNDTTLATFDELYTDGGILSNDPAPLGAAIARGKDRLFASDPSDGTIVRYSQPFSDGYGVQWPPDLFQRVDLQGGNVTALATIDDRIIVWTERQIWTFSGDGPDETGSTETRGFSAPRLVPGSIGCTDPQSIVSVPSGYMYKSAQGIYLLGGDASTSYIGAPVEAFNTQTVRRATQLPDRTQILFLTDSGSTLLYDYLFDQWSTFTDHEGYDSIVVANQFFYLRTDGRVFAETPGAHSDAGTRIRLRLETAWIHMLDQLQGFQRFFNFHLLGTWISAHQLGVQYRTDYMQGWTDEIWFDATGETSQVGWISAPSVDSTFGTEPISGSSYSDGEYDSGDYGGTAPGEYAWRLDLYETGQSIRFRFEDFEAAGLAGPSFELTELVITGQALGNVRRPMTAGRSA